MENFSGKPNEYNYFCLLVFKVSLNGNQEDNIIKLNYVIANNLEGKYKNFFRFSPSDNYTDKEKSEIEFNVDNSVYQLTCSKELIQNETKYTGTIDNGDLDLIFYNSINNETEDVYYYKSPDLSDIIEFFHSIPDVVYIVLTVIIYSLPFVGITAIIVKKARKRKRINEAIKKLNNKE